MLSAADPFIRHVPGARTAGVSLTRPCLLTRRRRRSGPLKKRISVRQEREAHSTPFAVLFPTIERNSIKRRGKPAVRCSSKRRLNRAYHRDFLHQKRLFPASIKQFV